MTMTGSFSLLFLLFFKYGHGPIVSNPFASRVNIHLHCRCFVLYSGSSNVCDYHWCYDWLSSCCSCRFFDVCEGWGSSNCL
ncbi:MAG: hypothetical protein NXY57DRAFT_1020265 [Lentinula lateritia]|nr:MAG: hypothetical protein NXY57DRAFT_1020265 [Lentinula lateritia]